MANCPQSAEDKRRKQLLQTIEEQGKRIEQLKGERDWQEDEIDRLREEIERLKAEREQLLTRIRELEHKGSREEDTS
jgi:septal ring factor EnvC (AmiA/AmiB activator)